MILLKGICVTKKSSILFVCGTEYQLLIAIILSTGIYKTKKKFLVLSKNNRVSYAYKGCLRSSIWDEVVLVDDGVLEGGDCTRVIDLAEVSDVLHYYSFGFKLHNHIFGLMSAAGKKIILTEEGLLSYRPKSSYESWIKEDARRQEHARGFSIERISEIWLCEPDLFVDELKIPLVKIDIEEFLSCFYRSDVLRGYLADIFAIRADGFVGKESVVYFQQYVYGVTGRYECAVELVDQITSALVKGDFSYIKKHPALVRTDDVLAMLGPWELNLLFSDSMARGVIDKKIYFSNDSTAMYSTLVFNGGVGTFFYLYKLVDIYAKFYGRDIDLFIEKLRVKFPLAVIKSPSSWQEFRDEISLIEGNRCIGFNVDAIPSAEDGDRRFKKLINSADSGSWGVPEWIVDRTPSEGRVLAIQTMLQANPDVGTLGVAVIVPKDSNPDDLLVTLKSLRSQLRPMDAIWLIGPGAPNLVADGGVDVIQGMDAWATLLSQRVGQPNTPDFLWILFAGDQLLPQASLLLGEYRLRQPDPLVWYADEAVLMDGRPANPMLKPDFNVDLLRSYPYVGRNLVLSTAAIQAAGGLDERVGDLAPIDLLWRLVEQVGPPVVGHVPEVLSYGVSSLMCWMADAQTMLWAPVVTQAHFERIGLNALVRPGPDLGVYRVDYPLASRPLVSIIIPTRDQLPVLQACIEGLMASTDYPHYELLVVDHQSRERGAVEFLHHLESSGMEHVRVLRWSGAFNFAALNNYAVTEARGDVLLFLNNDIQFSDCTRHDWLTRMLAQTLRAEVGAVGSRLDLPSGVVDHYGLVLGMDNSVGAAFHGQDIRRHGYMNRMIVQQNVSALSASCLMMRRAVFEELGGFDAQSFPVYYADADLCMKATRAGYLLVQEPDTGLLHMGGATRLLNEQFGLEATPDDAQRDQLYARWLPQLAHDPNYHPAFGKTTPGFELSPDASRIHEPLPGRPLPVVMAVHADWHGCGHYRVLHPFKAMSDELRLEGGVKHGNFHFTDVARIQPDIIVLQGAWIADGILEEIRRYREITGAKVILEFDDYLPNIPTRSIYRKRVSQGLIRKMRRAIEQVDWLVVSTPTLAQEYVKYHEDIRVARNGLYSGWWRNLSGQRRTGRKIRVGWAGGSSHTGDLAEIRSVVKDLEDEVEWVFMGMKPDNVRCEFHAGVPIDQYPMKLASLNLDLAVVPLEINQFNRCKSNLRLLELGACGVPAIASDIEPYRGSLPVTLVRNRHQDWVEAIRSHVSAPDVLSRAGDDLRNAVLTDWTLEGDFLDQWGQAWGIS